MNDSVESVKIKFSYIIISLATLLVGLLLLYISEKYATNIGIYKGFIDNIASIIMISGTLSAFQEYFIKKSFIKEIHRIEAKIISSLLNTEEISQITSLGLHGCSYGGKSFVYQPFIEKTNTLYCALNSGSSWVSANNYALENLMAKPNSEIVFIMPNPNSDYAKQIEKKENKVEGDIKRKILEACDKLITAYRRIGNSTCKLQIYWHDFPVVHACYIFDDEAIFTPYTISPERTAIPTFIFRKTDDHDLYSHFKDDLHRLIKNKNNYICIEFHKNNERMNLYTELKDGK